MNINALYTVCSLYNFTANIFQQAISLNTPVDYLTNLKLIDNND